MSTAFSMWLPLTVLLLAGIVSADYEHGWQVGNEYTYLVRSRTVASLGELSDQHTGILIKALLTIQVTNPQMLAAKVSLFEYARIFSSLPEGWDTEISDQMLELREMPFSDKPFGIKLKHGVIKDIIVDRNVPTWEVNILKSIVNQLQVDSLGENAINTIGTQIPTDEEPYGSFKTVEDSVGGKCEVLYDMTPLSEQIVNIRPELVPIPTLKGDGQHIDIRKSKNFDKCDQRMNYQFGIVGNQYWEAGSNKNGKFFSQSSTSRIVISGTLKSFTIQSAVTTNMINISPRFYDHGHGLVASKMNLTLASLKKITNPIGKPNNPESTGNLVYTYSNPFSENEELRVGKIVEDSDKMIVSDSVISSSSEEATKDQDIRSSSSGSFSSISSSEDNNFSRSKPTMENPPQNPLSTMFMGFKGEPIGKSSEVDVVAESKELIYQIANEMEDPSDVSKNQILEKFTILCSLLRSMSKEKMLQVEKTVRLSPHELKLIDKAQVTKQNAWTVLRAAIAQAGTGPAFLIIKDWIEKKEVSSTNAADLLAKLPKTARAPTAEYLREFFKLATGETVKNDPFLSNSALIAFSQLVHDAQVSVKSTHNHYPVHPLGRLTSKHDKAVSKQYIPYLAGELKKAVDSGKSQAIQTYIMALGNIGHPKILPVFEPYLEGKEHLTVYQRTLMVSALSKLAENYPKLTRSILYKIYLNTMDSHEVRCTAVFILMKTDPPLTMLQQMAAFTKIDTNKYVNSAVKSTLESLATLKSPESQTLAKKARAAKSLLSTTDYSYHYSHGYISDSVMDEGDFFSRTILKYTGSDDNLIPNAIYYATYSSYGDFKIPTFEVVAMVSSIKSFMELTTNPKEKEAIKWAAEKIAEQLNIIPDKPIPLEGNLMWNGKYGAKFLPFDRNALIMFRELLTKYMTGEKEGTFVNQLGSYDVTFGFPTETGLPFVYDFKLPTLYKIDGSVSNEVKNAKTITLKTELRILHAMKIQGRIGFVVPFEHKHYIAGVDLNFNVYLPMKMALDVDLSKVSFEVKLWPLKGENKARLLHYSVIPIVASHDILSLRPLTSEKTTQILVPDKVYSDKSSETNQVILDLEVGESDNFPNFKNWFDMDLDNLSEMIMTPWISDNDKYRKLDVFLNLEREQVAPLLLKTSYDFVEKAPDAAEAKLWASKATAMEPSDKKPDSQARRKQWMDEAAKGIKSAKSMAVDIQIQIPVTSEESIESVITIAVSNSEVEKKGRTLVYWGFESLFEVCAASQMKITPDNTVFYDQVADLIPKVEFNADLRVGSTCSSGEQFLIKGKATQTEELKERIKNSPLIKTCQKQMQQGNKILRACQNAATISMILDQVIVSVDFQSPSIVNFFTKALIALINTDYLEDFMDIHTYIADPRFAGRKVFNITVSLVDDFEKVNIFINTPAMSVHANDIDLSAIGISTEDILMAADEDMDIQNLLYNEEKSVCALDKTRAQTFDGKEYPLRLGNCWHVVMTTYPQANPENPIERIRLNKDDSVAVLILETEKGQKIVKVLLGDKEIKLVPISTQLEVFVNGQAVEITEAMSWQERDDKDILLEIYKIDDHVIGLVSDEYELKLVYDGERLLIEVGDRYRKAVRGLCGNFDGQPIDDFTAPKNCVLRKPEKFIASYALTKEQCEGESLENAKLLTDLDCIREEKNHLSNVISDAESGRTNTDESSWGYNKEAKNKLCIDMKTHIKETEDKLCFTIRQVPSCASGCSATQMKSKEYQFHCMKKDKASINLKDRINKGAKPDLSQKSVTFAESISVPLACKA